MDSSIFSSLFMDYNWNNIKLLWLVFLVIFITMSIFNNPRESLDGIFKGIGRAMLAVLGMIVFSYITLFLFAIASNTPFVPKIFLPLTLIMFYYYFIDLEPYIAPELFPESKYNTMIIDFRLRFPACFTAPKQPLALDIKEQLIKTKLYSLYEITKFLEIYCNNDYEYKKVLIPKAKRVRLNGEVSSLVTQEQLQKEEDNEAWHVSRMFGRVWILITIIYFIMWLYNLEKVTRLMENIMVILSLIIAVELVAFKLDLPKCATRYGEEMMLVITLFILLHMFGNNQVITIIATLGYLGVTLTLI